MSEYIFRFPANCPELTAEGLAAYLGPRKHRGIGRTVMITHHAARPRLGMPESFHVELYGRIIAQVTPEGWVYFPATGDTHLATREWLARIVTDNGIGTSVFRIRRHAGDPPGHGPLVIGGDRDRPVEGRSYPVRHKVSATELRELWNTLATRGELWNGMTAHYLREQYGDRLYHTGEGWFVRPKGTAPAAR